MQTFIPVPGTDDAVAIVSGSSPVLDLAESFLDLFGAITSTFRFVVIDETHQGEHREAPPEQDNIQRTD